MYMLMLSVDVIPSLFILGTADIQYLCYQDWSHNARSSLLLSVLNVGETEPDQLPGDAELDPGDAGLLRPVDRGLQAGHGLNPGALVLQ